MKYINQKLFIKMEVNKVTYLKHLCHQVEELLILTSTLAFITFFIAVTANVVSIIS